jgi:hypothetical protein
MLRSCDSECEPYYLLVCDSMESDSYKVLEERIAFIYYPEDCGSRFLRNIRRHVSQYVFSWM